MFPVYCVMSWGTYIARRLPQVQKKYELKKNIWELDDQGVLCGQAEQLGRDNYCCGQGRHRSSYIQGEKTHGC